MDTTTLLTANTIILWVMALALALAGRGRRNEPFWSSWALSNVLLGAALLIYIVESALPRLLIVALPNGLLVLGMSMRWRAARQFSGRDAPSRMLWGPIALFLICAAPFAHYSYAPAFTIANIALAGLSAAVAWEFWRDRADGLPSRYALVAAYLLIAASFGVRIVIGILQGGTMPLHLPLDMALLIHLLVAAVHTVATGAFALSLAFERSNAELRYAASHDALTGLLNRGAFEAHLHAELDADNPAPFALALFDLDHFKQVNDRFGHAAGDEALRRCADICRTCIADGDVAARIGGEEFAVVLKGVDAASASAAVEHIRRVVAATPMYAGGHRFSITISGGLCHNASGRGKFDELIREADAFLYGAKNKGRNRIETIAA